MRKKLILLFLICPLYALAQVVNLGIVKDRGWATWSYETLEFRDDCTILKGYFVPSGSGCWVISKMDEKLVSQKQEYRIIYTSLPTKRHPRTVYRGGEKVLFEERFEPIFSTGRSVKYTCKDLEIDFQVPFNDRKPSVACDDLLSLYEHHIDTLTAMGRYDIAAYLLDRYVDKVWPKCSQKSRKAAAERIMAKYKVADFFLNVDTDRNDYILSHFRNVYVRFNPNKNDKILQQLRDIRSLQTDILLSDKTSKPEGIQWCDSLLSMVRHFGKYNKCYENALTHYRKALVTNSQTQRVQELDKEIIEVCSHVYASDNNLYLERLMNIASDLDPNPSKTSYDMNSGINLWKEVRDKAKQCFPDSWRYARGLQEIANYNYRNGHYDLSLHQYLTIDSLYTLKRNAWVNEVWFYNDILTMDQCQTYVYLLHKDLYNNIGKCYYQKGELANAVKYAKDNPYFYYELGDHKTLTSLCKDEYEQSVEGLKTIIRNPTILAPGGYYSNSFDKAYTPVLTDQIPFFAYATKDRDLYEMAYNGALIAKEFRLIATNRLRHLMMTTDDPKVKEYIKQIDKETDTYKSMRETKDIDSVDKYWEVVNLQRELLAYLDSISALNTLFANWKDVHNALGKNDISIEFMEFPLYRQNQKMYVALTLRKDDETPTLIPLFEERQFKEVPDTIYYQCAEMTDLVWKPLRNQLKDIQNIYFSPSGAFYNIAIEYLPGMENYNIYRLSSTRELAAKEKMTPSHQAALYGGLDYYANVGLNDNTPRVIYPTERADVRGMDLRGGKEYLPHTKDEVQQIEKILTEAHWGCSVDSAANGTEESFKALSGEKTQYLHLATHGFYYTPEEADYIQYDFFQINDYIASDEDKALSRSGLILSGANHLLEGEELPVDAEDGILTAKEIAQMDLRGLDLVVLSACQTGLGDIAQSEGVFGLQRGFKKAGANSILMSLWEVDDRATQILMTQFYKRLLARDNKCLALKAAQQYLRKVDGGKYDAPQYWAAFILLDGLNKSH